MENVQKIREALPEAAKDLKLNLSNVLEQGSLTEGQRWAIALASAIATRSPALIDAVSKDAEGKVTPEQLDDAKAAAALMGMNNVWYRFKHFMKSDEYEKAPARLRMQRIAKPASSKAEFELYCLAVSTVHGCEMCVTSHEKVVREAGMSLDNVVDAVRIAATIHGVANAMMIPA